MSTQITIFRNLHNSLHLYIKNTVLRNWHAEELNAELTYDATTGLYLPDYAALELEPRPDDRGRGWVYFDYPDLQNEQTTQVTVYPATCNYRVNYVYGGIEHTSGDVPTEADFKWNYVSVVDEWPQQVNASELPIVVVDISTIDKGPYQLGGGKKLINPGMIHIFATSKAERDDLMSIIHDAMYEKHLKGYDFSDGTPLFYDGFFNTGYVQTTLSGILDCGTSFENVVARTVYINQISPLNEFRARINYELHTFM
jgi:hypothetical protein